jgi:hypothetical protein
MRPSPRGRLQRVLVCTLLVWSMSSLAYTGAAQAADWVAKGFLPVTETGAVPDDGKDDTAAIQKAVERARDAGLVVYFPSGTYVVSDTIRAMQPTRLDEQRGKWHHDRSVANVLVGADGAARPRLKLADNAEGFDNPNRPKPLVWIWAQPREHKASGTARELGSRDPEDEQPNISMNQVFKGIDLDLRAKGNRGAVGIRHAGSQGSTLEDVDIFAEGAFAGIMNATGQGGGNYRLRVLGGDYGIWADHRTRFPIFAGLELRGQRVAPVHWAGQSNMTIVGFVIEPAGASAAIRMLGGSDPVQGALTLVDGAILAAGGVPLDNSRGRNLFIKDVAFKGAEHLLRSGRRDPLAPKGEWTLVEQYAYTGPDSVLFAEGKTEQAGAERVLASAAPKPDLDGYLRRHVWDSEFPSFDQSDVVSAAEFGAKPDDGIDDSRAIEAALKKHEKVFLPRGTYEISETLRIPKNRHLIGAAKHTTAIRAARRWDAAPGTPIVATESDPDSAASLSFLRIDFDADQAHTALAWGAGPKSVVRDVMIELAAASGDGPKGAGRKGGDRTRRLETYRISGAGRWYATAAPWNRLSQVSDAPDYRHLRIADAAGPLALYGLNIERSRTSPQSEIVRSKNVSIYYLKSETLNNQDSSVISIRDSEAISIYGYSGIATPRGNAIVSLQNSTQVLLANVCPLRQRPDYDNVVETGAPGTVRLSGQHPVTLFARGK